MSDQITQVTGYNEQLDSNNRELVLKCTEDGLIWGYVAENGHRISDSQFDVTMLDSSNYSNWSDQARDILAQKYGCYSTSCK